MAAVMTDDIDPMLVVRELSAFDRASGNALERAVFNHRRLTILLCLAATLVLAFFALRVSLNASFEKMIPTGHPYIQNYLQNKAELRGLGNTLRVVVENANGDVFDPRYLDALKHVNDELFLT